MEYTDRILLDRRLEDGSINEQSVWRYIKERNSCDPLQLQRTAIIDCTREYTFEQMFAEWERYARVFSALGMTQDQSARVGIAGTISAEPLFAFYGLNMTGTTVSMLSYPDFLPSGHWKTMVEKEKLTDLLLSDIMITPATWPEILKAKEELGIRNIILMHSRLGGPCAGPAELVYNEFNYHMLKKLKGTVYMDDLLQEYADVPVRYGSDDPDRLAVIAHTSGTTKGTRKPLPYTNRSVNTVATRFGAGYKAFAAPDQPRDQTSIAPCFDFSSFLCIGGFVNSNLSVSDAVVLTFFGFMHPKYVRAVKYYKLDVLFTSGFVFDTWLKRKDTSDIDFSSLLVLCCGGSYLPPDKLKKYTEFAHSHGFKGEIIRGYGLSEAGGTQLSVPPGCMDDILGFPVPLEDFFVQDENDGRFYTAEDGVRSGVLYMVSDSLAMNELDGEVLFEYTKIDGRDFVCTNDLVRVNPDGSFSYAGRADRYFVNNDGVRFEAGVVETLMSGQDGIDKCAVAPVMDKRIHDTVPVLYIIPEAKGEEGAGLVCKALRNIYIRDGLIATNSLPSQFILVDHIPCNANGKIDIYRITRERLKGEAYDILPVSRNGEVIDIDMAREDQTSSITAGTLPEGMEGRSFLSIYDLLNTAPEEGKPLPVFNPLMNRIPCPMTVPNPLTIPNPMMVPNPLTIPNPMMVPNPMMIPNPMLFMPQAFMMPMQLMQPLSTMPFPFRQGPAPKGFTHGNMIIPPELLRWLLQMEMSPENLENLQQALDFMFASMP